MADNKMQDNTVPVSAEEYRTLVEAATKLQAVTRMMEGLWGKLHAQAVVDQFNVITGFEVTISGEEFE